MTTRITLLRHGQIATQGLFCATHDEPLSATGYKAMQDNSEHKQWDNIVSSPFKRCQDFALALSHERNLPCTIDKRLAEMDFGEWNGLPSQTIWQQSPELMTQLWQTPEQFCAPNGETMLDFIARVEDCWKDVLQRYSKQSVLLVTHGGVIRVLLAHVLGVAYEKVLLFQLGYGKTVELVVYEDGGISILSVN